MDNPQALYVIQEESNGLAGLALEREFKDQLSASNHACTPVPAQVWDLALPFGKDQRAQGDLLKGLQSWISSTNWPAYLGPVSVRLRLLVEPSGKISLAVLASGQEPNKAERALLDGLVGRDFQVKVEGFAVAEMNLSIGGMRCAEIPGEIERRP